MNDIKLDEALRLAAWLQANAKHMKYEDERVQMIKAARMLRFLDSEINNNLESLCKARTMLAEMKEMLEKVYGLPKQEAPGSGKGVSMSSLWR